MSCGDKQPIEINLIVAIHGILTGRGDVTWPERFERWAAAKLDRTAVLTDQYDAGPFPVWNYCIRNPRAARALGKIVENWIDSAVEDGQTVKVHIVAHSNGGDIARRLALRLTGRGYEVENLLLFSAAVPNSAAAMGLIPALDAGTLKNLVVYSADGDRVLAPSPDWSKPWTVALACARWPYGNAGRVGITDFDCRVSGLLKPITGRINNRLFPGWEHGDFFPPQYPGRVEGVFSMIGRDMKLPLRNQ